MADEETVKQCNRKAHQLRESILTRLTSRKSKVLMRSVEKNAFPELLDSSVLEAVNWQVVNPEWKSARVTLAALDTHLRLGPGRGYALGFTQPAQLGPENLFTTLRAINAMRTMKKIKEANQLLDWIVEQAAHNAEMIPESFHQTTAAYTGSYPTIGMGAAVFILAAMAD